MSRHQYLILTVWAAGLSVTPCHAVDVAEIVRGATIALRSDWDAAPGYAFLQRDEFQQSGRPATKTHQVVMIAGSDYYMPVAVDDQPLAADQQRSELQKLKNEFWRRNNEDHQARRQRTENYRKQREQNGRLTVEFPTAFIFSLEREETIHGRRAYVLAATPRKRAGSSNRAAKVLAGMRGRMWIEKESFHMIQAESNVIAPVSIFSIFARVLPGTHMELEMAPASDSIWLVRRFVMALEISKFWIRSTQTTSSTYSGYRPNGAVLDELLSRPRE